jgi:hypothetical protein
MMKEFLTSLSFWASTRQNFFVFGNNDDGIPHLKLFVGHPPRMMIEFLT